LAALNDKPRVTAVFIGASQSPELTRALASVAAQRPKPIEIVLFGNGADLIAPAVALAHTEIVVAGSESNLGVAVGRNAAARRATSEYLLFVDDDAALADGALEAAVRCLDEDPTVGAVAFSIRDPETKQQALWYYAQPVDDAARRFDVPWFIGCANLIRRDLFWQLGGFWPGYFRELEEIDLSWRIWDAGYRIRFEPRAVAEHAERSERHLRFSFVSNLMITWRLLPASLALRQTVFFLALFTARAIRHGELGDLFRGLADLWSKRRLIKRDRQPLNSSTVAYLRAVYSRQGWGKRLRWSLRRRPLPDSRSEAADRSGRSGGR
jgi:GT2 family glycosyltransferase